MTDINELADAALDAAALVIQDALGVQTGDAAGLFFSGADAEVILDIFRAYIKYEMSIKGE